MSETITTPNTDKTPEWMYIFAPIAVVVLLAAGLGLGKILGKDDGVAEGRKKVSEEVAGAKFASFNEGVAEGYSRLQKEAINNGFAQYDATGGQWRWKTPDECQPPKIVETSAPDNLLGGMVPAELAPLPEPTKKSKK